MTRGAPQVFSETFPTDLIAHIENKEIEVGTDTIAAHSASRDWEAMVFPLLAGVSLNYLVHIDT